MPYLIVSSERRDEKGAPLYWSTEHGWGDIRSCTCFGDSDPRRLDLPLGGAWHYITEADARALSEGQVLEYRHPVLVEVGKRLRTRREARGLDLESVARRAGLTVADLSRVEEGREDIDVEVLMGVLLAIDLDPMDLFSGLGSEGWN